MSLTVKSQAIPNSRLHRRLIYNEGLQIGEYERSQAADIRRKTEEVLATEDLLLEIYRRHGAFCVRWTRAGRKKSIRLGGPDGREIGVIPKSAWRKPTWVK
jgi:hypothetical protein